MNDDSAVAALSALAHADRLAAFRMLVRAGRTAWRPGRSRGAVDPADADELPTSRRWSAPGSFARGGTGVASSMRRATTTCASFSPSSPRDCCSGNPEICGNLATPSLPPAPGDLPMSAQPSTSCSSARQLRPFDPGREHHAQGTARALQRLFGRKPADGPSEPDGAGGAGEFGYPPTACARSRGTSSPRTAPLSWTSSSRSATKPPARPALSGRASDDRTLGHRRPSNESRGEIWKRRRSRRPSGT